MTVGARIRAVRNAKNLTLADVACKVGITPQALSYIERNERRVSVELHENIATALQVDINTFFAHELNDASIKEGSIDV